uniref:Uncharacterized protein n=1 Tax=Anguilla anguilla TaxID=7936 RepID=A0A0E9Q3P2_ANGAN
MIHNVKKNNIIEINVRNEPVLPCPPFSTIFRINT